MEKAWPPFLPKEFLFCLSLQAGVVACCTVGVTLMTITLLSNIYQPNEFNWKIQAVQYILLSLYLIIMMTGYIIGFMASFWERSSLVRCAGILISIGTVLFTIYAILSFVPRFNLVKYLCPGRRCPDQHWLVADRWRKYMFPSQYPPTIDPWFAEDVLQRGSPRRNKNVYDDRPWIPNQANRYERTYTYNGSKMGKLDQNGIILGTDKQGVVARDMRNNTAELYAKKFKDDDELIQDEEEYASEILFVILSFLYVVIYIVYLVYSVLAFFAFTKQLEME